MKCTRTLDDHSILKECWGVLECSWEMREIVEHFRDYEKCQILPDVFGKLWLIQETTRKQY